MSLQSKDGLILNGFILDRDEGIDFARYVHKRNSVTQVEKGVPFNTESRVFTLLEAGVEKSIQGIASADGSALNFNAVLFSKGVVVEKVKHRQQLLEFLVSNAKNAQNRKRAEQILAEFKVSTGQLGGEYPLFIGAVTDDGHLVTTSTGVLLADEVDAGSTFVNGKSLLSILDNYVQHSGLKFTVDNVLGNARLSKAKIINVSVARSEQEVKEAIALIGCLLTIRGFHQEARDAREVAAEWNLVAQPLLQFLPGARFTSYDMPWAFSSFKSLNLPESKRLHANNVAPYLTAAASLFVTSISDNRFASTRLISLLNGGQWTKSNGRYSCLINGIKFDFTSSMNHVIDSGLALSLAERNAVANEILQAAAIYGQAAGDGTLWASSLYNEWLGITGIMGGLTINIGSSSHGQS